MDLFFGVVLLLVCIIIVALNNQPITVHLKCYIRCLYVPSFTVANNALENDSMTSYVGSYRLEEKKVKRMRKRKASDFVPWTNDATIV